MDERKIEDGGGTFRKEKSNINIEFLSGYDDNIAFVVKQKMEIGLIFKIAAVGILITILGQVLKHSGREEHAFLISLAGLIVVLSWILPYIYNLFQSIQTMFRL